MKLDELYTINGIQVTVRREDKRYKAPLPPHGKMGVVSLLCKYASSHGHEMIGCFGSKTSNWVAGVPILASHFGLKSMICYPAKRFTDCPKWLQNTAKHFHSNVEEPTGLQLHLLHPNMTQINSSQAKKRVESRGGFFIPFGFDMSICVDYLSFEFRDMPDKIGTLVVSCGSGITLASLLRSARRYGKDVKKILAVSSGRPVPSIIRTVKQYEKVPGNLKWFHEHEYSQKLDIETLWPCHSHYELKAYDVMQRNIKKLPEPIYFINIGVDLE